MTEYDPQINPEEILQDESPEDRVPPISVSIDAPVQTRELPSKHVSWESHSSLSVNGEQIISRDPRRKWYIVIANDGDVMIGSTQAVSAMTGAILNEGMQTPKMDSLDEVWASSVDGANLATVSIITSFLFD